MREVREIRKSVVMFHMTLNKRALPAVVVVVLQAAQNERPRQLTEANTAKQEAEFQANITLAAAYSEATMLENR